MKLLVDIGNMVLKASLCEGTTLGKTFRYQGEFGINYVMGLIEANHPDMTVICSAREIGAEDIDALNKMCPKVLVMDPAHKSVAGAEMIPDYLTPDTVASVVAARSLFSGRSCSIFDFGTIITSSFLSRDGRYLGGNISPGSTTRFRSIRRYARNLPLLSETDDVAATGNSIASAIRSGVVSGIMFEIEGYISMYPDNIVIFTGGDSNYFAKRTKNTIFVISNLVLMGLAFISDKYEKIN